MSYSKTDRREIYLEAAKNLLIQYMSIHQAISCQNATVTGFVYYSGGNRLKYLRDNFPEAALFLTKKGGCGRHSDNDARMTAMLFCRKMLD